VPAVKPEILTWARTTAGLSVEMAAQRLGIRGSKDAPPATRLREYESGSRPPSRSLLSRMARVYRRPLLVFYLDEPPRAGDRGEDFRSSLSTRTSDGPTEALIDALLRDVRARQGLVRSVLVEEDEARRLDFVGSASMSTSPSRLAARIADTLGVSTEKYREAPSARDAFNVLRDAAERAGVFVLLIGDLGSHHTALDTEVFRGFVAADDVAPFVVVNDRDSATAWAFTLFHELAHLWLGQSGVSGGPPTRRVEQYCNDVAAAFLLPPGELDTLTTGQATRDRDVLMAQVAEFAADRHVSGTMVAYALYRSRRIPRDAWLDLASRYRELWLESRDSRRVQRELREGGPDYYVVRRHRMGQGLVALVGRMVAAGALSTTKAGKVLGVSPKNVGRLVSPQPRPARP